LGADAWLTLGVIALSLVLMVRSRIAPDVILVGALTILIVSGVLSPETALAGLGNPGLATVGILYVVVAGLVDTGAVFAIGARLLGRPRSVVMAQTRLMLPVAALSAFLNNIPIVAMLVPVVEDWGRRCNISVSKLMIPLSYATIFGGTCSLIGTSTNLVVHGLVLSDTNLGAMGFFEIGLIGVPSALAGILYVLIVGQKLLPERKPPLRQTEAAREYAIEMLVENASPLIGQTVEQAGLRHLPGAFLAEIERADTILPAVAPTERLRAGDRLLFVGVVDSMVELVRLRGLVPAPDQLFKLSAPRPERRLIEVVVSDSCPIVGHTIRDGQFRSRYDAVVIAVARNGERLRGKVGDVVLHAGDTLLLESRPSFITQQRNSRDFLLVSEVQGAALPRHDRASVAVGILALMVIAVVTGLLSMLEAGLVAAALMLVARCTTVSSARARIDWSVLTVIGASLGIGQALHTTGAAEHVAGWLINLAAGNPWLSLAAVYVATSLVTAVVTNNAAAVLIFPIAQATAASLGVSFWPFIATIMMAASSSFATPMGYQTNLMVYGPGGYRFADYVRIGLPLNMVLGVIAVVLAPLIWPFVPGS
jgi:di/tricarboxylate transporter